ncbi:hypothetical protein PHLGIDRAFT_14970 [Phlebiopsis gigantea 11061_1 CR5-6]|uniref:Uncharacterized protein n=1 Tax=Phlebiopsis gigantea (strain 11061_1 CR5-6) TaxID=745531 RepID=A0A0C3S416_PHLG1|nr:hypothetical protein PHLGIDRAFT_14970 [Phlebiopsis gigantea 11061_1 CR5-6]
MICPLYTDKRRRKERFGVLRDACGVGSITERCSAAETAPSQFCGWCTGCAVDVATLWHGEGLASVSSTQAKDASGPAFARASRARTFAWPGRAKVLAQRARSPSGVISTKPAVDSQMRPPRAPSTARGKTRSIVAMQIEDKTSFGPEYTWGFARRGQQASKPKWARMCWSLRTRTGHILGACPSAAGSLQTQSEDLPSSTSFAFSFLTSCARGARAPTRQSAPHSHAPRAGEPAKHGAGGATKPAACGHVEGAPPPRTPAQPRRIHRRSPPPRLGEKIHSGAHGAAQTARDVVNDPMLVLR